MTSPTTRSAGSSTSTSRRMPRSSMVTTGTSGSGMLRTAASAHSRSRHDVARSPRRPRVRARDVLHLGQQVPHRRASGCPAGRRASASAGRSGGSSVASFDDRGRHGSRPRRGGDDGSTPTPASAASRGRRVVVEQLGHIRRSTASQGRLHPAVRLLGAVAEPQHPLRARGRGGRRPPWAPWRPPPASDVVAGTAQRGIQLAPGRRRTTAAAPSRTRSRRAPARRGARCGTAARRGSIARSSSERPVPSSSPMRVSSARAWPSRSRPMLARAMSSSICGARRDPLAQPLRVDQRVVGQPLDVLRRNRIRGDCWLSHQRYSTSSGTS